MSSLSNDLMERAQDLIIARATTGLSEAEGDELSELLAQIPASEVAEIEAAVDATRSALFERADDEPLPAALRERVVGSAPQTTGVIGRIGPAPKAATSRMGWLTAAACLALAGVTLLWTRPWAGPPSVPSARASVDAAPDVVRWAFTPKTPDYQGASGEVVWSDRLQKGYMRLKGIAANDPRLKQFQLWIVDPARDERPVDGGVFDIASSGEVIVPFESRLTVRGPAAFAITAEKPGGVVVSAGPLHLVAAKQ